MGAQAAELQPQRSGGQRRRPPCRSNRCQLPAPGRTVPKGSFLPCQAPPARTKSQGTCACSVPVWGLCAKVSSIQGPWAKPTFQDRSNQSHLFPEDKWQSRIAKSPGTGLFIVAGFANNLSYTSILALKILEAFLGTFLSIPFLVY